ncbi:MAG: hypothetical protein O9284_01870 [Steroidobacteraceae bacterium]|jgi:hypothetical protein|nr:hypothetical protein [Steroidobacteraceae bacterium]
MQSADPDTNTGEVVALLEAANDESLPTAVGASGPVLSAQVTTVRSLGAAARGSGSAGVPTAGPTAEDSGPGWDPFEVWRTRIRDARRAASEPRED